MKTHVCVTYSEQHLQPKAQSIAQKLGLDCHSEAPRQIPLHLNVSDDFVELIDNETNTAVHVDFLSGALAHRKQFGGGRGQAIAKAIGLKPGSEPPGILDATAGLAKDAFVLANLGCPVTMIERSPIVATLVEDALQRAATDHSLEPLFDRGFKMINTDAQTHMQQISDADRPDLVYLDPMYPEKKKSALVKKSMQILQKLLGHDLDTEQLLADALTCARTRVVVKRPKTAPSITGPKPTMSIESKKTRYDVYVIKAMG